MVERAPFVVVADRDAAHEELLTAALVARGYEVAPVRSVWELHFVIEERAIDVLLVDLTLFGSSATFLNGILYPRRPALVVLMLVVGTGMTLESALANGFDGCFSKAVDERRLDRFLRDHLPRSRRPSHGRTGAPP